MHVFHVPVMGTGFTIDTPIKIARFGISSVVSLGDDNLIEKIREYYAGVYQEHYEPITEDEPDHRAARITAYLDLMNRIVCRQAEASSGKPLAEGLAAYFELLPEESALKRHYLRWLAAEEGVSKDRLEAWLKRHALPGSIDVNIMTKADRENTHEGQKQGREFSDAMAALRGYARSGLRSSVVFSAGLNLHLYSYMAEFDDFFPEADGSFKKRVILKVSDFRSAAVQARILAKKGIWISEYRIESGLNCGGHAFATDGYLMGPILEEFKTKRRELAESVYPAYLSALADKGRPRPSSMPAVRISAQGGVGTAEEQRLLIEQYGIDSVGWGSPFLLVPEATTVDEETMRLLAAAGQDDISLSHASPLGVRFYNLRNSPSEVQRRRRIEEGRPGSPCYYRYLAFSTEFGQPLCTASAQYQRLKLRELDSKEGGADAVERERVLDKACICRDLGNGALIKYGLKDGKREMAPAVCPGPNLAYFDKIVSLKRMVDHIYGRTDLIGPEKHRPHFFVNELRLYVRYWKEELSGHCRHATEKQGAYLEEFRENLLKGIEYYRNAAGRLVESAGARMAFLAGLDSAESELRQAFVPAAVVAA